MTIPVVITIASALLFGYTLGFMTAIDPEDDYRLRLRKWVRSKRIVLNDDGFYPFSRN